MFNLLVKLITYSYIRVFILMYFFVLFFTTYTNVYVFLALSFLMLPIMVIYSVIEIKKNFIKIVSLHVMAITYTALLISELLFVHEIHWSLVILLAPSAPGFYSLLAGDFFLQLFDSILYIYTMFYGIIFCFYASLLEVSKIFLSLFHKIKIFIKKSAA